MGGLEGLKQEQARALIGKFYMENWMQGKVYTIKHFKAMNIPKSTIYRVLQRYEEGTGSKRKSGSGRPAIKMTNTKKRMLIKEATHKVGATQRKLAKKYDISVAMVNNILKKNQIKYSKRKTAPKYYPGQQERAQKAIRKLRRDFFPPSGSASIVMDDESYFCLKNDQTPANSGYYQKIGSSNGDVPENVRFKYTSKYPEKLLMWITISEKGISEPFFLVKKASLNGATYRDECIKSRLLPFLEKYHSDQDFFFWPDLATCHYAKDTQELYSSLQIPYIPRDSNPPNTPQLRPIEKFWAILKDKVYEGGWEATTFRMLKQRVLKSLKNLDPFLCQNLFRDLKTKIRKADDVGVMAVI